MDNEVVGRITSAGRNGCRPAVHPGVRFRSGRDAPSLRPCRVDVPGRPHKRRGPLAWNCESVSASRRAPPRRTCPTAWLPAHSCESFRPGIRWITQDEYDKEARELKRQQIEIALRIEQHQKGEGDFRTTLESLIVFGFTRCRAIRAFENRTKAATSCVCVFEPGAQGRKARVFARARSPFDLMVNRASYSSWLGD